MCHNIASKDDIIKSGGDIVNEEKFSQMLREVTEEQEKREAQKVREKLREYDKLPQWKKIIYRIKRKIRHRL